MKIQSTPEKEPAPKLPPLPPPGPWWSNHHKLHVEPALGPDGQIIGFAVYAKSYFRPTPEGIIAVTLPEDGEVAKARWAAKKIAEDPATIDQWRQYSIKRETLREVIHDYRDRPPFVTRFRPEDYLPDGMLDRSASDDPYLELAENTRRLEDLIRAARGPLDPLSILFEWATREDHDDGESSIYALAHARAAYFNLPPAERQRIRSGWLYDDRKIISENLTVEFHPQVVLSIHEKGSARLEWAKSDVDELSRVKIEIMADTDKATAIGSLRRMVDRLESEWEKLVVEEDEWRRPVGACGTDPQLLGPAAAAVRIKELEKKAAGRKAAS